MKKLILFTFIFISISLTAQENKALTFKVRKPKPEPVFISEVTLTEFVEDYAMPDVPPRFPLNESIMEFDIILTNEEALSRYLTLNTKYPKEAKKKKLSGTVKVNFIVQESGSLKDIKIQKSDNPIFDKEALIVVKSMPKWIPATKNGKPIAAAFTVPVKFKFD